MNNQFKSLMTLTALASTATGLSSRSSAAVAEAKKTNVIFILADDLGYGDLGCYGQTKFETPNIDKLAASGMLFTQNYAGNTVSAPSRCSLITGRHSGHTEIRGNRELEGEGQLGIEAATVTVAELMKEQDYATGAFGKWGLGAVGGEGDPNNQGFDEFFGYNCQRQAHRYYPEHLWHNQEKVMLPGNEGFKQKTTFAPDLIQEKALDFITKNSDKPFFAYVAIVQPHAEILAQDDEHMAKYNGKFEETPFVSPKSGSNYGDENFDVKQYCDQEKPHATFAAMVSQVDEYVGEIMAKVEELGIADNTLIIFSSDNGPHLEGGADPDFFNSNGPLTGYKRSMTDGGIRLPLIASWKGTIKEGQTSDHITAFWDLMPTLAELTGVQTLSNTDGVSYLPTLTGKGVQQQHDYLYWEYMGNVAVRMGDWKAIKMRKSQNESGEFQLFDIANDIAVQNNVAAEYPDIVEKISNIMDSAHVYNANFPLTPEETKRAKNEKL
ncbi:MAG: arylsulfatase [Rikenellaceae bacterium]